MNIITQKGRSMVEMLGVLAIVGVLSVGAIAGYSKAMMKYKLNKHAAAYSSLLFEALKISKLVDNRQLNSTIDILDLLEKTNSIPDGYKKSTKAGSSRGYDDIFGNRSWIVLSKDNWNNVYGSFGTNIYSTDIGKESCRNMINVARENANNIWYITIDEENIDGNDISYESFGKYYDDDTCRTSTAYKCLKDITLDTVETLCHQCDTGKRCRFYVAWRNR